MTPKLRKFLLAVLALGLLSGVSVLQGDLSREREQLGLTRYTDLKGAPPMLALTTVALGGFRGLISNALWIRASDLQEEGKYFEMVQLADWITKLEPTFSQVWVNQAWNMGWNISVKFKDPEDRWRWLQRAIELLRDEGLKYNPYDILIHRELAWIFQDKMGAVTDEAQKYYKQMWANQMAEVFGLDKPDWEKLIHPQTDDEKRRAAILKDKLKMDPVFMKMVDEKHGPLEWRLPEASAIYWAEKGLEDAERNKSRIDPEDLIRLRRVIYQSMQLSFQRGRLVRNQAEHRFEEAPNLAIIPKVNAAYLQAEEEDVKNRAAILIAHRYLLADFVFALYSNNQEKDAAAWYKYLGEKFPDKPLLEGQTNSLPRNLTLDDYAIGRIQEEVNGTSSIRIEIVLEGLLRTAFRSLALGENDKYYGLNALAQKVYNRYTARVGPDNTRVGLRKMDDLRAEVLQKVIKELPPEQAGVLLTYFNLPPPTTEATSTNSPAAAEGPANAPAAIETTTNAPSASPPK